MFYYEPRMSEDRGTLYEHCARALDCSLAVGAHGLPLMGAGDWNDGMNRVGRGDAAKASGWAGFSSRPARFRPVAECRGDGPCGALTELGRAIVASLDEGLGRRVVSPRFFDDGTPLGSASNDDCQIDSLPQSWAVISGAAIRSARGRGWKRSNGTSSATDDRLALFSTPPFDRTRSTRATSRAMCPVIRENGGQYTHAAVWSVWRSRLWRGRKALEFFDLLNPIHHASRARTSIATRSSPMPSPPTFTPQQPHAGRGGWTWYTGAAGWLYRAGLESILGLRKRGGRSASTLAFRASGRVRDPLPVRPLALSDRRLEPEGHLARRRRDPSGRNPPRGRAPVPLSDDGSEHQVEVVLG